MSITAGALPPHGREPGDAGRLILNTRALVSFWLHLDITAGGLPPHGRENELGSPYIKYKGSCLILAASRQLHLDKQQMSGCSED